MFADLVLCFLICAAAFLEPEAVQLLVEKFNIKGADTKHPADEIKRMMAGN